MRIYILHIETATAICSVAISREGRLIASLELSEGMNHIALLTPLIEHLFRSNGIKPEELAAISVSSGPGSYTGLRVGSSTAKSMAYTLQIPILAIPTLLPLANAAFNRYPEADLAMPMLDARRKEVYTAMYKRGFVEIMPISSLILEAQWEALLPENQIIIICGDGSKK